MYASDITRTVPVSGHFTARQREIYDVVLGAQKAAIDAFVSGKSKIGDRYHTDPDGLDLVAYNYVNTHGKSLDGQPLGKYWIHPLSHMVGIDVLAHVARNFPQGAPQGPFTAVLDEMLKRGWLGDKTGGGFYKKTRGADGKAERTVDGLKRR